MKKWVKILLIILFLLVLPAVVMIAIFEWDAFWVGGILFLGIVTFSPMPKNIKPPPKNDDDGFFPDIFPFFP